MEETSSPWGRNRILEEEPLKRRRRSEPGPVREQGKVLSEKLVYYCSDFDLNESEWYSEFENIYIFKKRVISQLGKPFSSIFLDKKWVPNQIFRWEMEQAGPLLTNGDCWWRDRESDYDIIVGRGHWKCQYWRSGLRPLNNHNHWKLSSFRVCFGVLPE